MLEPKTSTGKVGDGVSVMADVALDRQIGVDCSGKLGEGNVSTARAHASACIHSGPITHLRVSCAGEAKEYGVDSGTSVMLEMKRSQHGNRCPQAVASDENASIGVLLLCCQDLLQDRDSRVIPGILQARQGQPRPRRPSCPLRLTWKPVATCTSGPSHCSSGTGSVSWKLMSLTMLSADERFVPA